LFGRGLARTEVRSGGDLQRSVEVDDAVAVGSTPRALRVRSGTRFVFEVTDLANERGLRGVQTTLCREGEAALFGTATKCLRCRGSHPK
jgi:hypothetical protein